MTHYLRRFGKTIVEVEATADDIRCVVVIDIYSEFLMDFMSRRAAVIKDFHDLQEMRGEWHEDPKQEETPDEFVERKLRAVAGRFAVQYVTD